MTHMLACFLSGDKNLNLSLSWEFERSHRTNLREGRKMVWTGREEPRRRKAGCGLVTYHRDGWWRQPVYLQPVFPIWLVLKQIYLVAEYPEHCPPPSSASVSPTILSLSTLPQASAPLLLAFRTLRAKSPTCRAWRARKYVSARMLQTLYGKTK